MSAVDRDRSASSYVEDLNAAVRENPVAAGLIGLGLAWMLFSSDRLRVMAGPVKDTVAAGATGLSNTVAAGATGLSNTIANTAHGLREGASATVQAARNAAEDTRDTLGSKFSGGGQPLGSLPGQAMPAVKKWGNKLSRNFEDQPLLMGLVGIGLGAAFAAALRPTQAEQDLMGERAADIVSDVKTRAREAVETMKDVAKDVVTSAR